MSGKTKAAKRELAAVEQELVAVLKRGTADIIKAGELLCECKRQVPHGEWAGWLEGKFSLSGRSAQKYMQAYRWAAKTALGADLGSLSPSALYELSSPSSVHGPEVVAAILKETTEKRVGCDRAWEIMRSMLPEPEPEPKQEPKPEAESDADDDAETGAEARKAEYAATEPDPDRWIEKTAEEAAKEEAEAAKAEAEADAAEQSKNALEAFEAMSSMWLAKMTAEDLKEAMARFLNLFEGASARYRTTDEAAKVAA